MSDAHKIGLLGFGEVGTILGEDLVAANQGLFAFDTKFPCADQTLSQLARTQLCESADRLAQNSSLIISAVTAENAEQAAQSVTDSLHPGCWYLDLNSCSPGTKERAAHIINQAGGRYVEAAVMSPVPPKRLTSPILLGGPHAETFLPVGQAIGLTELTVFSPDYGKCSAAKMCRSVMIKGMEALLTEALVAARAYGVENTVLSSLDNLFPGPNWPQLAKYMIERTLEHGGRRAEEMREVCDTVAKTGLVPEMSAATVKRQDWAKAYPQFLTHTSLSDLLDALGDAANSQSEH